MAPFSLLSYKRWPITLKKMIILSLNCKHSNRKKHQPRGKIEAAAGFGMVHALTPLPDTAKLPTVISRKREHAAWEGDMEETSPQQSSNKVATWKCENAYETFLFTT